MLFLYVNDIIFDIKMAKYKFKLTSKPHKDEIIEYLDELKNFNQKEIPFTHITRVAECLGFELQIKQNRGKGSQERFFHKELVPIKPFNGYVGIHIVHKGGDKILVNKVNYKAYLDRVFRLIANRYYS